MSLYGVIGNHVPLTEGHIIANHLIYGVIGYHVTLNQSPCGNFDLFVTKLFILYKG